MTQPSDIKYFLSVDGEDQVPIANHMTVGRHLDNDLLLAGEEVLDYHLRIEMTDRGPRAVPLGDASLRVNDRDLAEPVGLVPGDVVDVGQSRLVVEAELMGPPEAQAWHLYGHGPGEAVLVDDVLSIGRHEDNALTIPDGHVSRHHARLIHHQGLIWLLDLGSANGSFVNGERVSGGCRLFHGDEIRFDTVSFQLIGSGADLTPVVRRDGMAPVKPLPSGIARSGSGDTTEFTAVTEAPPVRLEVPAGEAGAFLLGASPPVSGMTFRTPMGRTMIGRQDDCDIVIRDRTVSARHAELMVRADGVTLTNLMATNGTRVNGEEVQTSKLHDGDVLRFGRVTLVYKDVPADGMTRPWLGWLQYGLMGASLLLAILLIVFLF